MVKIDALVFGYRRIRIDPNDLSTFTSLLIRASIPSVINNDGTVTVRERDFENIMNLISGRIEFRHSEPLGLYGFWKRLENKIPIMISVIISVLMVMVFSGFVWDIRVEGNEVLTDSEIILSLSECGFEVGDFWFLVDRGQIETAMLDISSDISWINLNKRGSVAYVKIIEKDGIEESGKENEFASNLIATSDCVIEEITVKRGTAVVKPGDTVKRGDLLVIGVMPSEVGGGWCAAEATVIGRIYDTVSVDVGRNYEKQTPTESILYSCNINFFKFSLNIFKRYRNLHNECDIIDNEIKCSLFDRCKLPLSITLKYIPQYTYENGVYTDDQLVDIGAERLMSLIALRLENADLVIGGVSSFGVEWFGDYVLPKIRESIPVLTVTKGLWDTE